MSSISEIRRSMAAGVAFAVLFVAGVLTTFGNTPNIKKHDSREVVARKYVDFLSSGGHRAGLLVGGWLLLLAAIALVWFTVGLGARLDSDFTGRAVAHLGVLGAASIGGAAILSTSVAGSRTFGNNKVLPDGQTIKVIMDPAFPLLFVDFGLVSAAIMVLVALTSRGMGLPSWLWYGTWVAAVAGVVAVWFFPMVLVVLWYLIVAVMGAMAPGTRAADA